MKLITRTISKITIKAEQVKYVNGVMEVKELPLLETGEKITEAGIQKHFKKLAEEGTSIIIKETSQIDKLYSISVEDFIKYGKEVITYAPKEEEIKETPSEEIKETPNEEIKNAKLSKETK